MRRDFPPIQTCPGAHPASCTMGTESFPGVKYGRGALLTTHPLLVPRSWKSRATPLRSLWATTGPVTGTLYRLTFISHYSLFKAQESTFQSHSWRTVNSMACTKKMPYALSRRRMDTTAIRPQHFESSGSQSRITEHSAKAIA